MAKLKDKQPSVAGQDGGTTGQDGGTTVVTHPVEGAEDENLHESVEDDETVTHENSFIAMIFTYLTNFGNMCYHGFMRVATPVGSTLVFVLKWGSAVVVILVAGIYFIPGFGMVPRDIGAMVDGVAMTAHPTGLVVFSHKAQTPEELLLETALANEVIHHKYDAVVLGGTININPDGGYSWWNDAGDEIHLREVEKLLRPFNKVAVITSNPRRFTLQGVEFMSMGSLNSSPVDGYFWEVFGEPTTGLTVSSLNFWAWTGNTGNEIDFQ